jgi:hypothetical protein
MSDYPHPNAGTSMSGFERIYLAGCAGPPYFPLSELHGMQVVQSICRYRPDQIEIALDGLALHRSTSALKQQLARALVVLAEQFGAPSPLSPPKRVRHGGAAPTNTPGSGCPPREHRRYRESCEICGAGVTGSVYRVDGRARCRGCSGKRSRRLMAISLDGVTLSPVCRDCGTAREGGHRCT